MKYESVKRMYHTSSYIDNIEKKVNRKMKMKSNQNDEWMTDEYSTNGFLFLSFFYIKSKYNKSVSFSLTLSNTYYCWKNIEREYYSMKKKKKEKKFSTSNRWRWIISIELHGKISI